jgi:hypothetical protein
VPARKFPTLLVVLAVAAGSLVFACGIGGLAYLLFVHERHQPVTQAERDILLTAEALAPFFEVSVDPAIGQVKHVSYLDGSRELSYEYDSPDEARNPLYISSTVNIERRVSDARAVYLSMTLGLKLGLALEGEDALQQVPRAGLFAWGDESKSEVLVKSGRPVGNVFAGRKGRRVFHLVLVGVHFDAREDVDAALGPVLRRFEAYRP